MGSHPSADARFEDAIDRYLDEQWDCIIDDMRTLVRIPSVDESAQACEGAPFGPGPRAALDAIMGIAARMGFAVRDCEGYVAYADLPGERDTQLGIIAHVDVVPAGPGWHFEPFELTEHEGYLVGRGTSDDKGPLIICLHALNLVKQYTACLPYSVRFIFGANEEVGMGDVKHYRARFDDPAFLFTPDAEFPVCYGEKGIFQGTASMKVGSNRAIKELRGGEAANAVPGEARAAFIDDAQADMAAYGRTAHGSTPELGENAIGKLAQDILAHANVNAEERDFLSFVEKLCTSTDGSAFGIACADEDFGPLTICGGMIRTDGDTFSQTIDVRFPTCINADQITRAINEVLEPAGIAFRIDNVKEPFLINADSPAVSALMDAYEQVTGKPTRPFTMGGGTYAREFSHAASFGMESADAVHPDWVGGMHAPDEAIGIEACKEAFRIYAHAISRLMECDITQ